MNYDLMFLIVNLILSASNGIMYVSGKKWYSMFACGFCAGASIHFLMRVLH